MVNYLVHGYPTKSPFPGDRLAVYLAFCAPSGQYLVPCCLDNVGREYLDWVCDAS
jgi:hypothetical protein